MNHIDLLKRGFTITWRYRALWVFGFFLALCSGGGGGGGSGQFNPPSGGDFDPSTAMPEIEFAVVLTVMAVIVCLSLIAMVLGIIIRAVTRTAIIGMVRQVEDAGQVSIADGWHFGWSRRAWRLFLVSFTIGLPVFIVTVLLILLAFLPLLLATSGETTFIVLGIVLTVLAFIMVIFLLIAISIIISPLLELSYRQAVFGELGIMDTIRDALYLLRARLKDVAVIWLLMVGVGFGWFFIALIVVLPLSLLAAAIVGGIPAALVYFVSGSWLGAAITGVPLGFIALLLVSSFFGGIFYVYQSSVWTLTYLELQKPVAGNPTTQPATNPQPAA